MQEKERCMILFFQSFNHFLCRFASLFSQNIYCRKNTAIIRWPPRRVTALQVMRISFLGPRSPPLEWKDHRFNRPHAIENSRLCLLLRTDILQNQLAVVGWNVTYASAFGLNNRNLNCYSHCSDNEVRCVSLIKDIFVAMPVFKK